MPRRAGFTLIELMIVVAIIAIIAGVALPSLLGSRKSGIEAKVIGGLRTLITVNEQYSTRFGRYPSDFNDLEGAGYLPDYTDTDYLDDYEWIFSFSPNLWEVNANPEVPGQTGDRYFYTNMTGVIRFSTLGPAAATDVPIQ